MQLQEFKHALAQMDALQFILPNGTLIPAHFHITEAGLTTKQYIDCGGTIRSESFASMQIWVAEDVDHRLNPQKLMGILSKSERLFGNSDYEVELEYQGETIGRFGVELQGSTFVLTSRQTACLAQDACNIIEPLPQTARMQFEIQGAQVCTPGGGCCS
jgi:Family of unknown function (DUF6428)